MSKRKFFQDDNDYEPQELLPVTRFDAEWMTLNALREIIGIAQKHTPSYSDALSVGMDVANELFQEIPPSFDMEESHIVRLYKQKARLLSDEIGVEISPIEALDADIRRYEDLLTHKEDPTIEVNQVQSEIFRLKSARKELEESKYTETQCILRDARDAYDTRGLEIIEIGKNYRDYHVAEARALRIRILHPDPAEHILGVDVVYEVHWAKNNMIRIVAIQYKMWNGRILYTSQADNLITQLHKMEANFCNKGYCLIHDKSKRKNAFRLPYCSTFLRPTDRIQPMDHRKQSSGYHIPVCAVAKHWEPTTGGQKKLARKMFRSECVTQRIFEELFSSNMLGSRWLTHEELRNLYSDTDILGNKQNIRIYAQEYGASAD